MKVIVSLSGGLDSTTVLALALSLKHDVIPVVFNYGSKHNEYENESVRKIVKHYGLVTIPIDLLGVMSHFQSNLLLSGGEIPEGHYESESMRKTVVPGRNTIFASILMGMAESLGVDEIWMGIHAGDHVIYPDCRPGWLFAIRNVARESTEGKVSFFAPFLYENKYDIIKHGSGLGVPYEFTRTCYKNQPIACGKCGSCQERLEAWEKLGKIDPIEYESRFVIGGVL